MKLWAIPASLIMAAAVFAFGVILMPAAELMPAQVTAGSWEPGLSPVRSYPMMQAFERVGDDMSKVFFNLDLKKALSEPFGVDASSEPTIDGSQQGTKKVAMTGEIRAYVLYSICLGAAFICAALAFNFLGRWDSEEKTVIPVKK